MANSGSPFSNLDEQAQIAKGISLATHSDMPFWKEFATATAIKKEKLAMMSLKYWIVMIALTKKCKSL